MEVVIGIIALAVFTGTIVGILKLRKPKSVQPLLGVVAPKSTAKQKRDK
jgi:hypothetical protein